MIRFDSKQGLVCLCVAVAAMAVGGCTKAPPPPVEQLQTAQPAPAAVQPVDPPVRPANPASQNCIAKGGRLAIDVDPNGGQYGVCFFEDNYQCEEWAMLRGHCPVGGIRVAGYVTAAQRFCAITGGLYTEASGDSGVDEKSKCRLPDGRICEAEAYYRHTCGSGI